MTAIMKKTMIILIRNLEVIQDLGKVKEKARMRMVRQGCDSNRTKEIQFKEPYHIDQFHHIGKIMQILREKPDCISNLPYPPTKTHFDIAVAGNTVDRERKSYGITITIRNP